MKMAFTRATEVRHISPAELTKIAEILSQPSTSPARKKLMQAVPLELTNHEHLSEGRPKYSFQNIRSIETAGAKYNKIAAQIFLEEWVTTGKIRPTLSHLLQLLIKSELFRAADYVAINLLSEPPPQRPSRGPAAKIDIALPQDTSGTMNLNMDKVTKSMPNKPLFEQMLQKDTRSANRPNEPHSIPLPLNSIMIESPITSKQLNNTTNDASTPYLSTVDLSGNILPKFSLLNVHVHHINEDTPNISIFNNTDAHNSTNGNVSRVTELLGQSVSSYSMEQQESSGNLSRVTKLLNQSQSTTSTEQQQNSGNVPRFSKLMGQSVSASFRTEQQENSGNVPRFSELLGQSVSSSPKTEQQESFGNVPRFSELLGQSVSSSSSTEQQESSENVPRFSELLHQSLSTSDNILSGA